MPIALISITTILAHASFNSSRLNISLAALAQGASPLSVGAIMSLFAALPMVLSVPCGRLVDRVGVRVPMAAAVAAQAAFVALPAAIPGIVPLYFAAAGIGTAFMVFHIAIQHAVGQLSGENDRRANFGWLALAFSVSNFLGPVSAGLSIDAFGNRATFALFVLPALAALAIIRVHRDRFSHTPDKAADAKARSAFDLLRNAELRRVFVVTGLLASAWDLFVFVMPIYGNSIGLSASTIGFILGSFALATFVVRMALPWISRHLREWVLITVTLGIAAIAYGLVPLVSTVPLLSAIAFFLGLGLGASQPSIMSLLYAKAPAGRAAEVVGIRSVVLNASHTVLPLAFGGVGAALGMGPVFWTMSAALVAGGVFADRRRRLEPGA